MHLGSATKARQKTTMYLMILLQMQPSICIKKKKHQTEIPQKPCEPDARLFQNIADVTICNFFANERGM